MGRNNIPAWTVTLDGKDLTGKMRPRLIGLSISEKRGDEADQLDIELDDTDGLLALPPLGATLAVSIGWKQGPDVTPGLVNKGLYKVDEIEHRGPPDQITLKARSADFSSQLRLRREQHWHDTTLGAVLSEIAIRNSLTARVSGALAGVSITSLTESREGDAAFLRRLGAEFDAVATIKAGCLIFTRKGAATSGSGSALPPLTITRCKGDRHRWTRQNRTEYKGVTASWHDTASAKRKSVTAGTAAGAKHLRKVYASEDEARRAAESERDRLKRLPATLDLGLALGLADAAPEQHVTLTGFKSEIDEQEWLITEVSHRLSQSGFITDIQFETAP